MSPKDIDDPTKSSEYIPFVMNRLKNEKVAKFEAVQIKKDGKPINVEVNAVLTKIAGEELILSVCRNITEGKHYQQSLEIYKNIVSSTADGIAFLDDNYKYIIVNDAYETFSGVNREEFLGKAIPEYLGADVFDKYIKPRFIKCIKGNVVNYQEWFEYPKLGRRCVDITYYPYKKKDGKIAGVIANTRDITDRRMVEEKVIESENKFRDIVEKIPGMAY